MRGLKPFDAAVATKRKRRSGQIHDLTGGKMRKIQRNVAGFIGLQVVLSYS